MSRVARILDRRPNGPLSQISLYRFRCYDSFVFDKKTFPFKRTSPLQEDRSQSTKTYRRRIANSCISWKSFITVFASQVSFKIPFEEMRVNRRNGKGGKESPPFTEEGTFARAMREGKEGKERDSRNRMSQMNAKTLLAIIINMKQKKMFVRYGSEI